MIFSLLLSVSANEVQERTFFLQEFQTDINLWCIRGIGLLLVIVFTVMYFRMKKGNGE